MDSQLMEEAETKLENISFTKTRRQQEISFIPFPNQFEGETFGQPSVVQGPSRIGHSSKGSFSTNNGNESLFDCQIINQTPLDKATNIQTKIKQSEQRLEAMYQESQRISAEIEKEIERKRQLTIDGNVNSNDHVTVEFEPEFAAPSRNIFAGFAWNRLTISRRTD